MHPYSAGAFVHVQSRVDYYEEQKREHAAEGRGTSPIHAPSKLAVPQEMPLYYKRSAGQRL